MWNIKILIGNTFCIPDLFYIKFNYDNECGVGITSPCVGPHKEQLEKRSMILKRNIFGHVTLMAMEYN